MRFQSETRLVKLKCNVLMSSFWGLVQVEQFVLREIRKGTDYL